MRAGPALHVGEEAQARVIQKLPDNRVLLDVEGTLLEATPPDDRPLPAEIAVRVAQIQPTHIFDILDPQPDVEKQATQLLLSHLPDHAPVDHSLALVQTALDVLTKQSGQEAGSTLTKLQDLLLELLPAETPATPENLAAFVRDGGLQYEAKLVEAAPRGPAALAVVAQHDVKGLLLQVLNDLKATQPHTTAERVQPNQPVNLSPAGYRPASAQPLTAPLTQHLNAIEVQQALNVRAQARGEALQLQVPFPTAQGMATAFVAVERDGHDHADQEKPEPGHHLLMMFNLDTLGETRIDAHLTPTGLRAIFHVERADALALMRTELPPFKERLHALGYREVLLDARPLEQLSPEKRRQFDALSAGIPADGNLIDVRA